jgi:hypothetical protein
MRLAQPAASHPAPVASHVPSGSKAPPRSLDCILPLSLKPTVASRDFISYRGSAQPLSDEAKGVSAGI